MHCGGNSLIRCRTVRKGLLLARRWIRGGPMSTRKIGRDAKTGEFISVDEAKRRPNTTVIETIKTPPKRKGK